MFTQEQACQIAKREYVKLWGDEWVNQKRASIFDTHFVDSNGSFRSIIQQDDRLLLPPMEDKIVLGTTPFEHMTEFVFDLQAETMEVTQHY